MATKQSTKPKATTQPKKSNNSKKVKQPDFLFERFNRDGERMFYVTSQSCMLESDDVIDSMKKAGYKFKLNGKVISAAQWKKINSEYKSKK